MTARFIVRLLDAEAQLLSWAEVFADAAPQDRAGSCPFFPRVPTVFTVEREGTATEITVHWADLDVARRAALTPAPVSVGQVFQFTWVEPVWIVSGMRDVPLPSVTVRQSVTVAPPTGGVGVKG